jgi:hypothetical protein
MTGLSSRPSGPEIGANAPPEEMASYGAAAARV